MVTTCTSFILHATFLFEYGCVCSNHKELTYWRGTFHIVLKVSLFVPVKRTKVMYSAIKPQNIVHTVP
jgi:hypothetical protein